MTTTQTESERNQQLYSAVFDEAITGTSLALTRPVKKLLDRLAKELGLEPEIIASIETTARDAQRAARANETSAEASRPLDLDNLSVETVHTLRVGEGLTSLSLSPCGGHVAAGSFEQRVHLWGLPDGAKCETSLDHEDYVNAVVFAGPSLLASGCDHGQLRLWELPTGKSAGLLEGHSGEILALAASSDGTKLVSGSGDRSALVFDLATRSKVATFEHPTQVYCVDWSHDNVRIVTGTIGTVHIWNTSTGAEEHLIEAHEDIVRAVRCSPDGALAASASDDGTIKLWDVQSGSEQGCFNAHDDEVLSLAFSPDGTLLASGGSDDVVIIWEVSTQRELCRFEAQVGAVQGLSFNQSGRRLFVTGAGGDGPFGGLESVRQWRLS